MRSIGVLGGGTAGYFAALALQRRFPQLAITLLESPSIPIIGVGEASTTLMAPFLHLQLGLDVVALYEEVRPTWKLGITFEWGPPDDFFTYPFGPADPVEAMTFDGTLRTQSLTSLLMEAHRAPLTREPDGSVRSLLPQVKWAYHLHNAPFVAFLARTAQARGITHRLAELVRVETDETASRVERLHFADGTSAQFDLYVDASGFRSVLLGDALGSRFVDYRASLRCDTALVTNLPQPDGLIRPATTAETMDCGWCWRIPVEGEDHRGYVFSSAFLDEAGALAEFRRRNPQWVEGTATSVVRFRSGRREAWWKGNVVAVGNAFGFVEPLESTALHMVIVSLGLLAEGVGALLRGEAPPVEAFNRRVAAHWDALRWFLAAHYRFNTRRDSPFWETMRREVDLGPLADAVARLRVDGPWTAQAGQRFTPADPTFGHAGLMMVLLGQRVDARAPRALSVDARRWAARVAGWREQVSRALPQAAALSWLREHPDVLRAAVGEGSWVHEPQENAAHFAVGLS